MSTTQVSHDGLLSRKHNVGRFLRKYGAVTRVAMQNTTVYSRSFIFGSLFFSLILFMFLQLWEKVSGDRGAVAGYTLNRLLWYYTVAETVALSRSDIMERLNQDIRSGDVAIQLLRPCHYLNSLFADAFGQLVLRLTLNIPIGMITVLLLVGPLEGFRLAHLPFMILSLLLGMFLTLSVEALVGLTAFWTEDNAAVWWVVQKLAFMLGLFLPLEMLPGWLRGIAVFLPFPYMMYAPARLASSFSWAECAWLIPVQLGYGILIFSLAHWIYRRGTKAVQVNGG
jgi:ABC-2 type transport system permease protein